MDPTRDPAKKLTGGEQRMRKYDQNEILKKREMDWRRKWRILTGYATEDDQEAQDRINKGLAPKDARKTGARKTNTAGAGAPAGRATAAGADWEVAGIQ